ncbi:MAG: hypothetical protein H7317_03450 [Pseudorhodobacter sp.]|nr:hypothetical protein [Pseudorhodobacter sp.]
MKPRTLLKESDLYPPVKAYLESQGYTVKSEIGHLDVLAIRGDEPPVVVELKTTFSLALVLQGVERQTLFPHVYLAVPYGPKGWSARYKDITRLCRRLGLGLLAVHLDPIKVEPHLDPGPFAPRQNHPHAARLLREFHRRVGDPNQGGTTGIKRMTAYRQHALRCAAHLAGCDTSTPATTARETGVTTAAAILRADHYGWFERVARGTYRLTPQGRAALPSPDLPG